MINRLKFNRRSLFRSMIAAPVVAAAGTEVAKSLVAEPARPLPPVTATSNTITGILFSNTCYVLPSDNVYLKLTTAKLSKDFSISVSKEGDPDY